MAYTIETAPAAEKQLAKLSKDVAGRIADAIERLAVDPFPPGSKPLKGADKGAYRIRIGDYRVLYEVFRSASSCSSSRLAIVATCTGESKPNPWGRHVRAG